MSNWIKVQSSVDWGIIDSLTTYLLCHEDGYMSIGNPYEFEQATGKSHPKMSVTHYMPLPDYPDDFKINEQ